MDDSTESDSQDHDGPLCTFAFTGSAEPYYIQAIYVCRTCCRNSEPTYCVCEGCARSCHVALNHNVEYLGMGPSYCDCATVCQEQCKMIQQSLEMLMKYQAQDCRSPSVTLQPVTNHFAFPFHVQAASLEFLRNIPTLCQSLVEQTQELVAHSKDTHWVDLHCSTLEQSEWCDLEKLAHWICISHLQSSPPEIQQSMAGAEWWVQIKRQNEQGDQGIELHYDKDETLAELWDLGSFPTLSTVTYLTANPALPTLIYPHSYHDDETREIPSCIVSYPSFLGKHLAFDGRLLHGAPYHEALLQQQVRIRRRVFTLNH